MAYRQAARGNFEYLIDEINLIIYIRWHFKDDDELFDLAMQGEAARVAFKYYNSGDHYKFEYMVNHYLRIMRAAHELTVASINSIDKYETPYNRHTGLILDKINHLLKEINARIKADKERDIDQVIEQLFDDYQPPDGD